MRKRSYWQRRTSEKQETNNRQRKLQTNTNKSKDSAALTQTNRSDGAIKEKKVRNGRNDEEEILIPS